MLTVSWVPDLYGSEVSTLCKDITSYERLNSCMFGFETMMSNIPSTEALYGMLNRVSLYHTSKRLYDTVVSPLVSSDLEPSVPIRFMHSNPFWVNEQDALVIDTKVTIPIGTSHRYVPLELKWYTGDKGMLVVSANRAIMRVAQGFNVTRGIQWTK